MKRLLVLLMALCCTSCSALPAEERAFAVALCAEKQGKTWQLHARIPTYKTGGGYLTVSGEGRDIPAALADLNASAPMHTSLSQLRLLVLSEGMSGKDTLSLLAGLSAQYDVRQQCAVAVTDAAAKSVAEALKPEAGARLSKAIDVLLEARTGQGSIPKVTLADVSLMGERQSPVLMRLGLKEGKIDLSGAYPMADDGTILPPLSEAETALLMLLRGDVKALQLTLPAGSARLRDVCAKVCPAEDFNIAHVTIKLRAVESTLTPEALAQAVAAAGAELLSRLSQAGCDALGLGRKAILMVRDMPQWHDRDWPERLREIRWEVSVKADPPA